MTRKFQDAKQKRKKLIERWRNGSDRQRELARKLGSCRPHDRCKCPECPVCQLLERREARARRAAKASSWRPHQAAPSVIITRASDIASEVLDWIWPGRIPRGKVTVIAGAPAAGKSQLVAFLAATVSKAAQWPLREGTAPLGSVIMLVAEDGIADTVVPRLRAADADLSRIHLIDINKINPTIGRLTSCWTRP